MIYLILQIQSDAPNTTVDQDMNIGLSRKGNFTKIFAWNPNHRLKKQSVWAH